MQVFHASKVLIALFAAANVALPVFAVPAGASPSPAAVDDGVAQRLQTAAASERIPVIVEGAAPGDAAGAGLINVPRALSATTPRVTRPHLLPAEGLIRALLPLMREADGPEADQVRWDDVRWDDVNGTTCAGTMCAGTGRSTTRLPCCPRRT